MAPYEALYGRKYRSPIGWFEMGETALIGPDLVQQAMEKNIRRYDQMSYKLELPQELSTVHPIFHVSMLRRCIGDPSRITPIEDVQVIEDLTYKEIPISILDQQVKKLRN
ncbi:unnamed protein product [Withania somnifera]